MLPYSDPKWKEMNGGYRTIPYDPTSALKRLEDEGNVDDVWEELWEELHHQGSVGEASYAAVPHLVRIQKEKRSLNWNLYALVGTIEIARWQKGGPQVPDWLATSYRDALKDLAEIAASELMRNDDPLTIRSILGFLTFFRGLRKFGALILWYDELELVEVLDQYVG